jgi:glycosyltransferase involved in cell wall biosynthesis
MRILDLGAHDGFVGTWLSRNMEGLHIDGIEANSTAVRIANERAEKHGIAGRYVQGLAEDAPRYFERGTYDAVVAYELIEHVPNVDEFLDVCEEMVNENGRVYLSTPNGTFGEGNNPHHLRAYRAVDLFELCRRRGRVRDMLAGHDGVTVISYEPTHERTIREVAIYVGPGWEKWHPSDIATKGLGGSETAAIRLAEALSESYTVTVYGECDYCAWRQVSFKPHHTFDPLEPYDGLIVSRMPHIADRPWNAKWTALWMHDTDYGTAMTKERCDRFDEILALSGWHQQHLWDTYPFLDQNVTVFGNAIEPRYFHPKETRQMGAQRDPVALYSSSPDRGLDLLLRLWPKVREQIPDAELHYCYASVYHKIAEKDATVAAFRQKIVELSDQPGVLDLGSLNQKQLAHAMETKAAWLAPSFHSPTNQKFYETYCIGAQEAAAGGACIVASGWGALPERVKQAANSILVPTDPREEGWEEEWVSAIVNAMIVPTYEPSTLALETTWATRASHIQALLDCAVSATV